MTTSTLTARSPSLDRELPDELAQRATVAALMTGGKGVLAADESPSTLEKRFKAIAVLSTEASRRDYRAVLLSTPRLNDAISGVILQDETIRQAIGGVPIPAWLEAQGIVPGIKVDGGTVDLAHFAGEKITQGLDGLRGRLAVYRQLGARFTKWRAVITVGEVLPTRACLAANARAMALFAARSQEAGLVPVVEPEVLMDGRHTLARCEEVTREALEVVFAALSEHRVSLEAMVLKTGMVLAGSDCPRQADVGTVAEVTLRCLRRAAPAAVGGILFLSGGQTEVAATVRLNAICAHHDPTWPLSFSFGRALQESALKAWQGLAANAGAAQAALRHRAGCNGLAVRGKYTAEAEQANEA